MVAALRLAKILVWLYSDVRLSVGLKRFLSILMVNLQFITLFLLVLFFLNATSININVATDRLVKQLLSTLFVICRFI